MKKDSNTTLEYLMIGLLVILFYMAVSYLMAWLGITFN